MSLVVARLPLVVLLLGACATAGPPPAEKHQPPEAKQQPQEGKLAPNAPADRPVQMVGTSSGEALAKWRALIAPQVAEAMAKYSDAKGRYLAGLPRGENFFVTTILVDEHGHFEQVFILVDRIESDGTVTGRIFSDIEAVHGFRRKDPHRVSERDIVDWLITKKDGSEEGNVVGKFVDTLPRTVR